MRFCPACNKSENETPFGKDYRCLACNRERRKAHYRKHIETEQKKSLTRYWSKRDEILRTNKEREEKIKDEVYEGYGGYVCNCCGETEKLFLCIDHVDGGGTDHRKNISGGAKGIYRWLKKNNYPEGFQVLCYNCNNGKHRNNNVCPHARKKH